MNRFCFVGASTTEGMGDDSRKGWVGNLSLAQESANIVFNLGVRGQTVFQIAERAPTECSVRLPNKEAGRIVLGATINEVARNMDGSSRTNYDDVKQCYISLFRELSKLARVALIGPMPILEKKMPFYSALNKQHFEFRNEDISNHSQKLQSACTETGVAFIELFNSASDCAEYLNGLEQNDGIHTNAAGYAELALVIDRSPIWQQFSS